MGDQGFTVTSGLPTIGPEPYLSFPRTPFAQQVGRRPLGMKSTFDAADLNETLSIPGDAHLRTGLLVAKGFMDKNPLNRSLYRKRVGFMIRQVIALRLKQWSLTLLDGFGGFA
jgi:hypothetical protein